MKKNIKLVIAVILAAVLSVPQTNIVFAGNETAVASKTDEYSEWAGEYIKEASTYGILTRSMQNGYKNNINRGHFCDIAFNMIKKWGIDTSHQAENPFEDTDSETISALYSLGIVNGKDNNRFEPDSLITREEAAVILLRMSMLMGAESKDNDFIFSDDRLISEWAKEAVYKMYSLGIMNGTSGTVFSPKDKYTKEQAIVTIMRLYNISN